MNAKEIAKYGILLAAAAALFYWRDVLDWASAKPPLELAGDILGFVLKYFFLAALGWLAVTVPHYVEPWLKLARANSRQRLRFARRNRRGTQAGGGRADLPRLNRDRLLLALTSELAERSRRRGDE